MKINADVSDVEWRVCVVRPTPYLHHVLAVFAFAPSKIAAIESTPRYIILTNG